MGSTTRHTANSGLQSPACVPPPTQLRSHLGSTNAGTETGSANGGAPVPCRWVFSKVSGSHFLCMKSATSQFALCRHWQANLPVSVLNPQHTLVHGKARPIPSQPQRASEHRGRQMNWYRGRKITLHGRGRQARELCTVLRNYTRNYTTLSPPGLLLNFRAKWPSRTAGSKQSTT